MERHERYQFGRYTYVDETSLEIWPFDKTTRLIVGSFTSIARLTRFLLGGHHMSRWCTTYPFYDVSLQMAYPDMPKHDGTGYTRSKDTVIGNDVWIGNGCTILSGVKINDGAIIGAGSVVREKVYDKYYNKWREEIPSYAIVVGNPAVITSYRFTAKQIEALLAIKWWNWYDEKIREALPLLCSNNIDELISKYGS